MKHISSMESALICRFGSWVLVFASIMAVHSQMDSCGADLGSFLPAPFNTSGLACKPIWKTFILRYYQSHDNTVSIVLSSIYTSGWVGIGFSPDGMMVGSSAMVGWIDTSGRSFIKQYDLQGRSSSDVIVDEGKLMLTSVSPKVVLYGVNIYLMFQVRFSKQVESQEVILAYANESPNHLQLTKHDDKISVSFDFSSGGSTVPTSPSSYPYQLKRNHGALAIFSWGILLPIGAIIARYFRHKDPLWFYLHVAIQFLGYLVGIAAVLAGISLYNKLNSDFRSHKSLGIFILVLASLQVIAFFVRPDKESKLRMYWNWYHHWLGRLALFLAAINITLGLKIGDAGSSWKLVYGIILAIILSTFSVLETMLWTNWSKKPVSRPSI
ncbi:Cytochrome b561 and DOMON domain-containing protein [Rhynchospora pubera]|uniref:Cytochrome b561 and DOMON domain-containing protein n=1 Tax=Rhynchospora pubera TaxID=906938 RepID=A0AAV8CBH5_9POAL|nr:Cytochrome b561 and DOMON domain-containing protein [Rhynchospora pubera]